MLRKFRVLIHGWDPAAGFDAGEARKGFWATRYVEAMSDREAAQVAMSLVRADEHLAMVTRDDWGGPPEIRAGEVNEIESFKGIRPPGGGYTFFEDTDEKH